MQKPSLIYTFVIKRKGMNYSENILGTIGNT
ncbi:MAG: hypothetical protein ACI9XR_000277, partial [Flavobacterium sp.]